MTNSFDQGDIKLLQILNLAENPSRTTDGKQNSLLLLDLKNLRDIIFVQDVNLQIVYASLSAVSLFGYTIEELKQLDMTKLMTPDSLGRAMERYQQYYLSALKVG